MGQIASKNKILGGIFLTLALLSFLWAFFVHFSDFNIPILGKTNSDIRINVKIEPPNSVEIRGNGALILPSVMENNEYVWFEINKNPVTSLTIKGDVNEVGSVVLAVGQKMFYYTKSDILNFEKNKNGEFIFPKINKTYINDKGGIERVSTCFLSIFYNAQFYIFPIIFLILSFIFLRPKMTFKPSFIWWIVLLGLVFRLSGLNLDFWTDEIYTAYLASDPSLPIKTAFQDPGNPPLFFILAKIWMAVFGQSEVTSRLSNVLISTFTIYFVYKFLYDNRESDSDENPLLMPLLGAFLFAVNIYAIVSAQELRSYALCIFLNVIYSIFLFKILKKQDNKNFILYTACSILMVNTHYFETFMVFSGFIFGLTLLKSNRIKFCFLHVITLLSFLPYLLYTGLNKGLLDANFNVFLRPDLKFYLSVFEWLSPVKFLLLIVLCFLFVKFKDKNLKIFYYSLFSIFSVFLLSFLFSFIKPVSKDYYFVILLPFFIFLPLSICFAKYKTNALKIFFIPVIFISFFLKSDFILRDKTSFINLKRLAYFYSKDFNPKEKNALIFPYNKEMYKRAYSSYIDDDTELFEIKNLTKEILADLINRYDSVYCFIEFNFLNDLGELSKGNKLSLIRTDKDILIGKIGKN